MPERETTTTGIAAVGAGAAFPFSGAGGASPRSPSAGPGDATSGRCAGSREQRAASAATPTIRTKVSAIAVALARRMLKAPVARDRERRKYWTTVGAGALAHL